MSKPRKPPGLDAVTRRALPARRAGIWLTLGLLGAGLVTGLAGCAGAPLPPAQWARLPVHASTPPAAPAAAGSETWQLLGSIGLPGHLDHSALLLPAAAGGGATRLVAHPQLRWAEPLRDAVPRLLKQDLQQALGAPVWTAPLPAALQPTHQLRLELLALDIQGAPASGVAVQARWALSGPGLPARQGEIGFVQPAGPATGDPADMLVLAHRQALAVLAQRLAEALREQQPAGR